MHGLEHADLGFGVIPVLQGDHVPAGPHADDRVAPDEDAGLVHEPIWLLERSLLSPTHGLARVIAKNTPAPLAGPVRVFPQIEHLAAGRRDQKRRRQRDCTDRASVKHGVLPVIDPKAPDASSS